MNVMERNMLSLYLKTMKNYETFKNLLFVTHQALNFQLLDLHVMCLCNVEEKFIGLHRELCDYQKEMIDKLEKIMSSDNQYFAFKDAIDSLSLTKDHPLTVKIMDFYKYFNEETADVINCYYNSFSPGSDLSENVLNSVNDLLKNYKTSLQTALGYEIIDKITEGTTTLSPEYLNKQKYIIENNSSEERTIISSTYGLVDQNGKIIVPIEVKTEPTKNNILNHTSEDTIEEE